MDTRLPGKNQKASNDHIETGFFEDGFDYGIPAKDAREVLPKKHQEVFRIALNLVKETTDYRGRGKKVYSLIHVDLGVDSNVFFRAGVARPFDFDDCGFGYWMFDLGRAMVHCLADIEDSSPKMQEALIEGYLETSPVPESNLDNLNLFIVTRYAQLLFFFQGAVMRWPQTYEENMREINHYAKYLRKNLRKM